ncbi:hypothetical protein EYF80_052114 [Liparis tanakae]|uniref:Uncharacterized protein n=1 Tax=Liparis tanakae TaxID=230148 RepID=A0A4Z2F975_9TELE|nr:hypothetical protein EYF80_052114 [Liparis tanakae]
METLTAHSELLSEITWTARPAPLARRGTGSGTECLSNTRRTRHVNTSTRQHVNKTTRQHDNKTTRQHDNTSTRQHDNKTTRQHDNTSTRQHATEAGQRSETTNQRADPPRLASR